MKLPAFYKPKHFRPEEFLPGRTFRQWGELGLFLFMDVRVLITADQIREFFGAPVTGNTWHRGGRFRFQGYRPDRYYEIHGKEAPKSGSQHRFGRAFDCAIRGVTAEEARDVIMNHQSAFPFIRRIEDDVSWLHFDVANTFHHGIHLIERR